MTYGRNCGIVKNSRLTMEDEPAKFHESQRLKFEKRRYVVSAMPVPESAPPQDISLVEGQFPSSLEIQLQPATMFEHRQWSKCPSAGQVNSPMSATIVDSQGKRITVNGIFTTADSQEGMGTLFVAPVDPAELGITYTLREPELSEASGFTLRIFFGQREGQVGTIVANVQRRAGGTPPTPGYSTAAELLALSGPA